MNVNSSLLVLTYLTVSFSQLSVWLRKHPERIENEILYTKRVMPCSGAERYVPVFNKSIGLFLWGVEMRERYQPAVERLYQGGVGAPGMTLDIIKYLPKENWKENADFEWGIRPSRSLT